MLEECLKGTSNSNIPVFVFKKPNPAFPRVFQSKVFLYETKLSLL